MATLDTLKVITDTLKVITDTLQVTTPSIDLTSARIDSLTLKLEAATAMAQEAKFMTNNAWMMLATGLVFIMHLGFATVESGLARSKNTVNILFKNTLTPCLGLLMYYAWGFGMMYPGTGAENGWFGFGGFLVTLPENGLTGAYFNNSYTYWTDFLFQGMFAATAATIVSGAVAERIKISAYMIFTLFLVGLLYPVVGFWKWGGGWLQQLETPFYDFAGSSIVHSLGGWAALAGILVLGPRTGKYIDGKIYPIPGHSMPLATIGVFLLWLGWFGFNGGSVLSADPGLVSLVLVTTSMAAAAGAVGAMLTSYAVTKSMDLSMVLNGILGGLVGITAGADLMSPGEAVIIGFISGAVVVFAVLFFDKIKIDDPVGATSVHLVCGILGTLFVGIFGAKAGTAQLTSQLIGIAAIGLFVFPLALAFFYFLKVTMGIRVSAKEEIEGLDLGEHGMKAYIIE
jgi:Amt family ammonium transporter